MTKEFTSAELDDGVRLRFIVPALRTSTTPDTSGLTASLCCSSIHVGETMLSSHPATAKREAMLLSNGIVATGLAPPVLPQAITFRLARHTGGGSFYTSS